MSFEGKVRAAIVEIVLKEFNWVDGVSKVLKELDELY